MSARSITAVFVAVACAALAPGAFAQGAADKKTDKTAGAMAPKPAAEMANLTDSDKKRKSALWSNIARAEPAVTLAAAPSN